MASVLASPKIYHITHWRNLAQIIQLGFLWSDAKRIDLGLDTEIVGISGIKERRLKELPVKCHPGTKVGEYVPFYFCPRSIMLYILHMGNHPELSYHEGQGPIVHLVSDLHAAVAWAEADGRKWAFSDRNAGARYAGFYSSLGDLEKVNWDAVEATNFRDPVVKDGKQAEFLAYGSFPWQLIEKVGVFSQEMKRTVALLVADAKRQPTVSIERAWYF
ncbi:MAG TPA: DUF4433 domain-containing protein [Thermoleophilia bacterium]